MHSEPESGDELVFLSPESEPEQEQEQDQKRQDTGASPQLRRSTRKRKSTIGEKSMTKGSSSKKKKTSPNKSPNMPKVPRSPVSAAGQQSQPTTQTTPKPAQAGQSFEALLLAMEGRITAKLEKASEASKEAANQAKLNSESLELLESRVDANEQCLMDALRESEKRLLAQVQARVEDVMQEKVKEMVDAQLHAAGFDQDLTAADLSLRHSVRQGDQDRTVQTTYAAAASAAPSQGERSVTVTTKESKREAKFWLARRSLRLWPIKDGTKEALHDYLKRRLRLEDDFIKDDLGEVTLVRPKEPRNKNKDEFIAIFENKHIRDTIKAAAHNLANSNDQAGMRLQVPDHLQKDFRALMNLSFDLKKKHPHLKRNVKFDEDEEGLFMDLKLKNDGEWQRVKPVHALAASKRRPNRTRSLGTEELESLLDVTDESS